MRTVTKFKLAAVVVVLSTIGAMALGAAASAPPPGTGWIQGIAPSALPTTCTASSSGGWGLTEGLSEVKPMNIFITTAAMYSQYPGNNPAGYRPMTWQPSEPCRMAATSYPISDIAIGDVRSQLLYCDDTVNYYDSCTYMKGSDLYVGKVTHSGPDVTERNEIWCANSEWSKRSEWYRYADDTGAGRGDIVQANPSITNSTGYSITGGAYNSSCPFITEIKLSVTYGLYLSTPSVLHDATVIHTSLYWIPGRFIASNPYKSKTPIGLLCAVDITLPQCVGVPGGDETDVSETCPGAPEMTWGNWGWLGDFVFYWANCLFIPTSSLGDSGGRVADAWAASSGGQAVDSVTNTMEALGGITESCGEFVSPVASFPLTMNTCDLATDFLPLKLILAVLALGFTGWFIVKFVMTAFVSIVPGTKVEAFGDRLQKILNQKAGEL